MCINDKWHSPYDCYVEYHEYDVADVLLKDTFLKYAFHNHRTGDTLIVEGCYGLESAP